jgi:hypothetical protein
MITFYGDKITADFANPYLNNRFLEQHIQDKDVMYTGAQQFTVHPQFNSSAFKYFKSPVRFENFSNYTNGKNVVVIGMHGGWSETKLELIKQWFLKDPKRRQAWQDLNCKIIIDYCEEGFTTEVFADLHYWIVDNDLSDRVLYVTSSYKVKEQYAVWCRDNRKTANMQVSWFGFFLTWDVVRDQQARQKNICYYEKKKNKNRFMCLNRRPWSHRILLLTLLQKYKLVEHGAVSMPLEFNEVEISWQAADFNIPAKWEELKERFNGYLDYLDSDFNQMYNQLPLIVDTKNFEINRAFDLNESLYRQYPINLISETLFFTDAVFASEKIWKPMLMDQIFIVMSAPYYLQQLRELGFKTFHPYINEEYDLIEDPLDRANAVVDALANIVKLSDSEFDQLLENCKAIVQHNKKLITDVDQIDRIISQDLVDEIENFWTR